MHRSVRLAFTTMCLMQSLGGGGVDEFTLSLTFLRLLFFTGKGC